MQQIINFIIRYKISLLYFLLLSISLGFTVRSHSYHQSKFFNSSNWISGNIYETSSTISGYFNLNKENKKLVEENKRLRKLLFNLKPMDSVVLDTTEINYTIWTGRVIKNSYANPRNYITINKGKKQGIQQDMGVITDNGILGIVESTSSNYASVQSILNTKSNINAKMKNSDHFGSLIWNTDNYNVVQLNDIPRLVTLFVGDTIVTGGRSSIFPENIPIGTIQKFDLNTSKSSDNVYSFNIGHVIEQFHIYIIRAFGG
ncbi:MAG: rod shape-determining protein MreC, partial [Bacteroidota bacterium]